MSRFTAITLPFLLAPALFAAESKEITVELQPFTIRHTLTASALPADFETIRLDGAAWTDFQITRLAPHGARVKKGDTLLAFDAGNIDRKIDDTRRGIEERQRRIAQAEFDLAQLKETTPHQHERFRRAAGEAKEENAYFIGTRRAAEEEAADQRLKRAGMFLENQREELRQLEKMYAAEELTEETEEIILHRQRDRVEAAEFELRMQKLNHKRRREVELPREAVRLAEGERDTAIALAKFEEESPRALAKAEFDLQALRIEQEREETSLANLEADRKQMEIAAPADGWFYHGSMEGGRFTPLPAQRALQLHGKAEVRQPLATFIAGDASLELVAGVEAAVARRLDKDPLVTAWLEGREDLGFGATMKELSPSPDPEGRHHAVFAAEWPEGLEVAPASAVRLQAIAHHSPAAMVLPLKALRFDPEGWTVAVKLADGKTERRKVERGRVFEEQCEILSGLETGQVVVMP